MTPTNPQDDDLARMAAALRRPPPADPEARAAAMAQAMENFDRLQGSAKAARLNPDRPERAGVLNGVRQMLKSLSTRQMFAATTSVAALCLGLVVVLPGLQSRPTETVVSLPEVAPATSVAVAEEQALDEVPAGAAPAAAPPAKPTTASRSEVRARKMAPEAGAILPEAEGYVADMMAEPVISAAPAIMAEPAPAPRVENTEAFANADANPVKITAEEPVSTFSTDVDTASYAIVRSSLNDGYLPDPMAVRVEEMVNYFPYAYPAPEVGGAPFRTTVSVMPTPWNQGTRLVTIGVQGRLPVVADRPPLNLVFLIDTSGSMEDPDKLPLLKQSLALMLPELRPEDEVAIVAYAGSAGEVLPPTKAADRAAIMAAMDRLAAGGATAGAEGLALAYQVAGRMAGKGEVSRVILATDGDFNVGVDDPEGLEAYVARQRDTGVYLSVLGFGRGNLDDATMQALAQNGNGTAGYIDTLNEARKVLVDQLTGALFPIADDVKVQVEWNPAAVAEYRLIGYETRALAREDFNNDKVDAGEIGAGLQVTAIYEVTAPGSPALRNDPLRYGVATTAEGDASELGFLRLRWKDPGASDSQLAEAPIPADAPAGEDARFAAAIAGFGQLLGEAKYLGDWGWDAAIALALENRGDDPFGYRIEAVNLMRLAKGLSAQ